MRLISLVVVCWVAATVVAKAGEPACFPASDLAINPQELTPRPGAPGARRPPPLNAAMRSDPVPPALRGSIRRVELPPGQKLIALSFDLCEAGGEIAGYDGDLVNYLRTQQVRATFFTGGKWFVTHPARAGQLIADPLFEIGNHTWTHWNLGVMSGQSMRQQVSFAQAAYEEARAALSARQCTAAHAPARMSLFRFPYGSCSAESLAHVNDSGLLAIQWDVDSGDPDPFITAAAVAKRVLADIRPGSIVLMHANGRGHRTHEALRTIIPALKAQGYLFVTVSDLLAAGRPVIVPTCYNRTPGDTRIYDDKWRARLTPAATQN
jgi:peptidoglycan/xylan/chitin deacetylase (PgdA/CDA1 family)